MLYCKVWEIVDLFAPFPLPSVAQTNDPLSVHIRNWISITSNIDKKAPESELKEDSQPLALEEEGLTTFNESSNVIVTKEASRSVLYKISNPYPDQTPSVLLSRNYQIDSFDWTPGIPTKHYFFPDILLSQPTIAGALRSFNFFRASVRIQIRMNSTPYHQGSLIVGKLMAADCSAFTPITLSMCDSLVLSASVQDSCTIDLPYVYPSAWMPLNITSPSLMIGSIAIQELNTLVTSSVGVPLSVPITVYASFVDPLVAGFVQPGAQSSEKMRFNKKRNTESSLKEDKGIDYSSHTPLSSLVKNIPIVGGLASNVLDIASAIASLDKPTSTAASVPMYLVGAKDSSLCTGVFYGETLKSYPSTTLASDSFEMISSDVPVTDIAKIPALFAQKTFSTNGDSLVIGLTPMTPTNITPIAVDYLTFTTAAFRFWRGSIKYSFHFVSSAFYSARFRIFYSTLSAASVNGDLPQKIVDVKGDTIVDVTMPYLFPNYWRTKGNPAVGTPVMYIQMISDISGSTMPSSPVIYLNVWRSAGEDYQVSQPVNAVNLPGDVLAQTSFNMRFKKQFPALLDDVSITQEMGNCMTETTTSISDDIKRWSSQPPSIYNLTTIANVRQYTDAEDPTQLYNREHFTYFASIFMFYKGSRRVRTVADSYGGDIWFPDSNRSLTSSAMLTLPNVHQTPQTVWNATFSAEIPYQAEVPYAYIGRAPRSSFALPALLFDPPVSLAVNSTATTNPTMLDISAGDDFKFLYLIPPTISPRLTTPVSSVSSDVVGSSKKLRLKT